MPRSVRRFSSDYLEENEELQEETLQNENDTYDYEYYDLSSEETADNPDEDGEPVVASSTTNVWKKIAKVALVILVLIGLFFASMWITTMMLNKNHEVEDYGNDAPAYNETEPEEDVGIVIEPEEKEEVNAVEEPEAENEEKKEEEKPAKKTSSSTTTDNKKNDTDKKTDSDKDKTDKSATTDNNKNEDTQKPASTETKPATSDPVAPAPEPAPSAPSAAPPPSAPTLIPQKPAA